ncbi:unnamed protein product [Didymodactylos carnosus]|uniref:Uncharacterized protein n=1 Tax=Didymodactylos carnosus TaxID=1234261 RepID=A0A815S1G1_9BILA|nr:unnamed protein product [Didymodactylos carnosus]CAF1500951.1 unnamed protein product [Didymodactylos carnosus]CAF4289393.1 unnamed protein product [Didymodactylos carnosus]CAF4349847.1 unnamed protein product [Didymodactylos carnosus]
MKIKQHEYKFGSAHADISSATTSTRRFNRMQLYSQQSFTLPNTLKFVSSGHNEVDLTMFNLCEDLTEICSNVSQSNIKEDFLHMVQTCVTSSFYLLHDIIRRPSTDDGDQQSTADSSTETVWHDTDTSQSQNIEPNEPCDPYLFRDEDELKEN